MVGREAYRNPWLFAAADRLFFSDDSHHIGTRREVVERYLEYAQDMQDLKVYGSNTCSIVKPLHNAFTDCPSAAASKLYKTKLDALLKLHSSKVDKKEGSVTLADIVHQAMEDTLPGDYLDEQVKG
jgi:tRNA-dihydrouridine synthase